MSKQHYIGLIILSFYCACIFRVEAQKLSTNVDPSGYVLKFNPNFAGIGPKVYFLPAPRTKKEELTDTYKEIFKFQDSIGLEAIRYRALEFFLPTENDSVAEALLAEKVKSEKDLEKILASYKKGDRPLYLSLVNQASKNAIKKNNIPQGIHLLKTALADSTENADLHVLQGNLASLYLLNRNAIEAGKYEDQYLKAVTKDKDLSKQAWSLLKIAGIQALDNDNKSAENTIIRKAVPFFNKSKDYKGKIFAWLTLAEIYQKQNKHTEAQWFLIQARDLSEAKKITSMLAEIEYLLGYSKYVQKNYTIAKNELQKAYELAKEIQNDVLALSISEALGNTYLKLNEIKNSDSMLIDYWLLRNKIF